MNMIEAARQRLAQNKQKKQAVKDREESEAYRKMFAGAESKVDLEDDGADKSNLQEVANAVSQIQALLLTIEHTKDTDESVKDMVDQFVKDSYYLGIIRDLEPELDLDEKAKEKRGILSAEKYLDKISQAIANNPATIKRIDTIRGNLQKIYNTLED